MLPFFPHILGLHVTSFPCVTYILVGILSIHCDLPSTFSLKPRSSSAFNSIQVPPFVDSEIPITSPIYKNYRCDFFASRMYSLAELNTNCPRAPNQLPHFSDPLGLYSHGLYKVSRRCFAPQELIRDDRHKLQRRLRSRVRRKYLKARTTQTKNGKHPPGPPFWYVIRHST